MKKHLFITITTILIMLQLLSLSVFAVDYNSYTLSSFIPSSVTRVETGSDFPLSVLELVDEPVGTDGYTLGGIIGSGDDAYPKYIHYKPVAGITGNTGTVATPFYVQLEFDIDYSKVEDYNYLSFTYGLILPSNYEELGINPADTLMVTNGAAVYDNSSNAVTYEGYDYTGDIVVVASLIEDSVSNPGGTFSYYVCDVQMYNDASFSAEVIQSLNFYLTLYRTDILYSAYAPDYNVGVSFLEMYSKSEDEFLTDIVNGIDENTEAIKAVGETLSSSNETINEIRDILKEDLTPEESSMIEEGKTELDEKSLEIQTNNEYQAEVDAQLQEIFNRYEEYTSNEYDLFGDHYGDYILKYVNPVFENEKFLDIWEFIWNLDIVQGMVILVVTFAAIGFAFFGIR